MKKRFNTTGVCVPKKHYMVNIDNKLEQIKELIDNGYYFVINRPRQYGKTTTMFMLKQYLKEDYLVLSMSFEGIDEEGFSSSKEFSNVILRLLSNSIKLINKEKSEELLNYIPITNSMLDLSDNITKFIMNCDKAVVLMIDEVDKSSNNQIFLNFLGMLRNKYLLREQEEDITFQSVVLAGVHDIKNLKIKLRENEEKKYNSPWNIAVNFDLDMSFSSVEIKKMLDEYSKDKSIKIDAKNISEQIYFYTNGYPFLVSRLCQIIDEDIFKDKGSIIWDDITIKKAVKCLLLEKNTLFDDFIKNLENNLEFNNYIFEIIMNNAEKSFNSDNPIINLGLIFGYFIEFNGKVKISNKIFEQRLYNYYSSKLENKVDMSSYNFKENFITKTGLDFEKVLLRFQQFVKEQYSTLDSKNRKPDSHAHWVSDSHQIQDLGSLLKREGRLLFLAFIKPIINGIGFDFKEVQISEEKRLDIVITYLKEKYLVELKIWRGEEYHKKGLNQLSDYLEINELDCGYLVIYNFNKSKEYKSESVNVGNKKIFIVWV